MLDKIDEILKAYGVLSAQSRQLFKDKVKLLELPKNIDIFVEGKKNHYEYLLISGILHRYNQTEKGDIVTTGFYMPKSVITPHFARTNNFKNLFSLESLTEAVVAEIAVSDLDFLRLTNQELRIFGQKIVENELSTIFLIETVFRSYSAKERLFMLRKQFPNLENSIPHSYIASYLGITNVSFSRLRAEIAKH